VREFHKAGGAGFDCSALGFSKNSRAKPITR
jgi:hypothetical protein